ncbi:MAG: prepilin-type N-terminal cleavage/methylation domain-containing protein [Lachnospiraceae bacterium]
MKNKVYNRLDRFRKKKEGFTLVELIVVLVILVILIALLVPALTGYIDKAKEKKATVHARMALTATQTVLSEAFGDTKKEEGLGNPDKITVVAGGGKGYPQKDIIELAELKDVAGFQKIVAINDVTTFKVTTLTYTEGAYTVTYDEGNGTWTVVKK